MSILVVNFPTAIAINDAFSSTLFFTATLVIVSASLTSGIELKCHFITYSYNWGKPEYTCEALEVNIEKPEVVITSITGEHSPESFPYNVTQLRVESQIVKFIPAGVAQNFVSLNALILEDTTLKTVERKNFDGLNNLTALLLPYNKLIEIPADAFADLHKVEFLSLSYNEIKNLSRNVFEGMTGLKRLHLHENKIEQLDGELFANNAKLEVIWLQGNRLRFIGARILAPVKNVKEVFFGSNVCIHDWYPGPATLEQLIEKIYNQCQIMESQMQLTVE